MSTKQATAKKTRKPAKNRKKTSPQTATTPPNQQPVKITIWHKLLPPAFLSLLTTAFYYPSLRYPFQFDDLANISKKFDIRFSNPLSTWWHNRRWMGEWLNRLNFDWGRFDPFYYRLTNLVIHILAGVFIYFLILEGCSYLKKRTFFANHALAIATTTAALFMLHPVQTQAVSYVIQARLEGLATLFVVATLLLILKAFHAKSIVLKYSLIGLALVVGIASCGTKEIAIVSPLLAILTDWFFLAEEEWVSFKSRIWFHALFSFVIFATFVHYLSPRFIGEIASLKMVTGNNRGNVLTEHAHDLIKPFSFLISQFKVILHYLAIFIWPFGLSVEYDWKLSESFFAPDSFFPFLALAIMFSLAIYSLIKDKLSFFGFGLLWFLIAIAPRSSIIPSPELICDYKTYLPAVGWLFVIATSFVATVSFLFEKFKASDLWTHKPLLQFALIMIVAMPVGYGAMNRNMVWSSSVEFWKDIVEKAPTKARGHNNFGVALSEANKFDEAIPHYIQAIKLDRFYSDPWSNLAVAYSVKNEIDKAIGSLKEAIRIFPNYPEAYNNLGTLMLKKKEYDAAEKILQTAIRLRPYYGKAFYNLGRLYTERGDEEKSWEHFKKATEGDLDTAEGFFTFGSVSLKLKKYDAAVVAFETALSRADNMPTQQRDQIMFNLANACFMTKRFDKAESLFAFLSKTYPNDHRYLYNQGEALFNKKDFTQACGVFKRLLDPPFRIAQATFRYANCLEQMKKFGDAKSALQLVANADKAPKEMKEMAQKRDERNGTKRNRSTQCSGKN